MKTKLSKLVQQLNAENAPPDGWRDEDRVVDRPEPGKQYALTGAPGSRCIANGNSWSESEVTDPEAAGTSRDRGTD